MKKLTYFDGFALIHIGISAQKLGDKYYPKMCRSGELPTFINKGSLDYNSRWHYQGELPSFRTEQSALYYAENRCNEYFKNKVD
jgi:hypothetical protein